jgi:hypothetical protein
LTILYGSYTVRNGLELSTRNKYLGRGNRMAGREKSYIRLVDIETGEEVAAAVMTAAAVKRIAKLYAAFGIYTKAVA